MQITENEISWLLVGTAIGSLITYWHLTKEKRIISDIREDIAFLAPYHDFNKAQYHKVCSKAATEELADDRLVLRFYVLSLGPAGEKSGSANFGD